METDKEFDRRITAAISARFEATGRNRADLAKDLGISRTTLDRSLDKGRPFATSEVRAAARVLHIRPSVIVDEAEQDAA